MARSGSFAGESCGQTAFGPGGSWPIGDYEKDTLPGYGHPEEAAEPCEAAGITPFRDPKHPRHEKCEGHAAQVFFDEIFKGATIQAAEQASNRAYKACLLGEEGPE